MKVLELNLPEPTVTKMQEAAERLSLSPEELAILSLDEKLGDSTINSGTNPIMCSTRTPNSISVSRDELMTIT